MPYACTAFIYCTAVSCDCSHLLERTIYHMQRIKKITCNAHTHTGISDIPRYLERACFLSLTLFRKMIYVTLRYTSSRKSKDRKTARRYRRKPPREAEEIAFLIHRSRCTTSANIDGYRPPIRECENGSTDAVHF